MADNLLEELLDKHLAIEQEMEKQAQALVRTANPTYKCLDEKYLMEKA